MATQTPRRSSKRRGLSLSVRFSLLLLFAALLPLGAVVGVNNYLARGTLVEQGRAALTTDARAKVNLLNLYMHERAADGVALASLPTVAPFLLCSIVPGLPTEQAIAVSAQAKCASQGDLYAQSSCRALRVGISRDPNYTLWSLHTARGEQLLSSLDQNCTPVAGPPTPAEDLAPVVQLKKQWISAVYYDAKTNHAYVQVYTPILVDTTKQVVGFMRATLHLDYIWNLVNAEKGANGLGSSAFVTDENGVRFANSNAQDLWSSVAPLDAHTQQLITSEQRFGTLGVRQDTLPGVAKTLTSPASEVSFQSPATAGSTIAYQFVRIHMQDLPWTYFVLSPLTTVTKVADDQVRSSLLSAGVIAILATLLGLLIGRGVARPVQASTGDLAGAALALKQLAARQENSAGEQQWVVDACRTGLDSVRYLSDAMNQAARRIIDASNWFSENWDRLSEEQARRTVQHLLELARYIDEAARRQHASSERMDKAIMVTMQVSDQLLTGATAATHSADQLEYVVGNLQQVVGGRQRVIAAADDAANGGNMVGAGAPSTMSQMSQMGPMSQMGQMQMGAMAPAPVRGARSGRLAAAGAQRQLAGPAVSGRPGMAGTSNGAGQMGGRMPAQGMPDGNPDWYGAPRAPRAPWHNGQPSQVFDDYNGEAAGAGRANNGAGYGQWNSRPNPGQSPQGW